MKRILIVGSLLAASHAWAADLPVPAGPVPAYYPVATVYDWGGGYIGINGGYAFGQSEWGADPRNPSGLSSTGNFNVNGGLVGGTIGIKVEYLFVDLGNADCNHSYSCGFDLAAAAAAPALGSNMTVKLNENLIRVGLNFKYGH